MSNKSKNNDKDIVLKTKRISNIMCQIAYNSINNNEFFRIYINSTNNFFKIITSIFDIKFRYLNSISLLYCYSNLKGMVKKD